MTVTLTRPYGSFAAGTVTELNASTEAALVAQGIATSGGTLTTGAYTTTETAGTASIAIGASSVVITNALVTASSKVWAVVSQAAADGTLLRVERVVPAVGSFTIFGTANATAATQIDWAIISLGDTPTV
jgi:hypothetical protein